MFIVTNSGEQQAFSGFLGVFIYFLLNIEKIKFEQSSRLDVYDLSDMEFHSITLETYIS